MREPSAPPVRRPAPRDWLNRHARTALAALERLAHAPLATLVTSAVVGITLALPLALHLFAGDLERLGSDWDAGASLSVFIDPGVPDEGLPILRDRLLAMPGIDSVKTITRDEALAEFRQLSGFGEALKMLPDNPLPAVLIAHPTRDAPIEQLATRLRRLAEVDEVQLDMAWLDRLRAISRLLERGVWVLGGLLGLAVLLTMGNTIRLEIQNRSEEIRVSKLIGASDAFIRRPFLYAGLWYGLFGGIIAWWLLTVSLILVSDPLEQLAGLYEYKLHFSALSLAEFGVLLCISGLLGLLGAWLAVSRHLKEIEPG
ncbi:MAG TPA: ABC transporter permease [Chromatiaceae bacterium]|nr:ABC transporter permease [Chromatiaceae bacterium]